MTNKELSIILRLRDEATKRLEGVRGNLQRFAHSWKQNWLAITAAITASSTEDALLKSSRDSRRIF